MQQEVKFPPVTSPAWTITGGAEQEVVDPDFKFQLPDGTLQSYYSLHAQLWTEDWGAIPKRGDTFTITTIVDVITMESPKVMRTYLQMGDVHTGGDAREIHPGINTFVAEGVYLEHGGSYVLTVSNRSHTERSVIQFKVVSVTLKFP